MATLRVIIGGPNLLLPSPPQLNEHLGFETWSLLMRQLSSGPTDKYGVIAEGAPQRERVTVRPHFPFVKIRSANVDCDDDRKPSMVYTREGETFHLYRLSSDFVRIGGAARGISPDLSSIDLNQVGAADFRGSLRWMFDLEQLLAGSGCVNSRRILDNGFPQQGRLACWLILDQGSLYTHALGRPGKTISQWDVRRKSYPNEPIPIHEFPRPVAYNVAADLPMGESVELCFLRLNQKAPQKIRLVPDGDGLIEISLLNEEMEEVLGFSERLPQDGDCDEDVGAVYQLSDIGRATRDRPLPHRFGDFPNHLGGLGSDTVSCGACLGKCFLGFEDEWPDVREALRILYS